MTVIPAKEELSQTIVAAARAHHEYQTNILGGVRHEQWAGWYAGFILGRHGDITSPSQLTRWLEEVPNDKAWFKRAAEHVYLKLANENNS
jgi:hypothetical protein